MLTPLFNFTAALFDATKGFVIPLHYVGSMVYLSAVVLALEPIFKKLDAKNLPNANGSEKTTQNASKLERWNDGGRWGTAILR